ncbi:MAG: hypothetical protein NTV32_00110, partial [Gammaproteobacteria bacterium]|nr:hypothetical protein [Gammaproteobacteria bacterium]
TDKITLLAAQSTCGFPGLFAAFQNGHDKAVSTFITLILASYLLDKTDKITLLAAQSTCGFPGLFAAFQNDHDKAVSTFINRIMLSTLDQADKIELVNKHLSSTFPKILDKNPKAASAFMNSILGSNLSIETKKTLLQPFPCFKALLSSHECLLILKSTITKYITFNLSSSSLRHGKKGRDSANIILLQLDEYYINYILLNFTDKPYTPLPIHCITNFAQCAIPSTSGTRPNSLRTVLTTFYNYIPLESREPPPATPASIGRPDETSPLF